MRLLIVILLFFLSEVGVSQEASTQKILFVGNSYTYFWNLPQNVEAMALAKGKAFEVKQSTNGGVNLGQHWKGERDLSSRKIIQSNNFNSVILQDHSRRAIDAPDSLHMYASKLAKEIQGKDGKVFLYMTWAREWDPYMQEEIAKQYAQLANKIGATLVPVGLAWQRARTLRPGFPLYDSDGSHPSPLGTYLTACMFYGALTGDSPIGLPNRLMSKDEDGEKLYLNIQSANDALFCQKVAAEILKM